MTPAQAKRQRRELLKDIAKEHKRQAKAHLAALKQAIADARVHHKAAIYQARITCRTARLDAKRKASARRAVLLLELRSVVGQERAAAGARCAESKGFAKEAGETRKTSKLALAAERQFRREMRQIERSSRSRAKELRSPRRSEAQAESDDEVRGNIPPELVVLFERVKRSIRASDRMTRTESFLHYAEEHPREVLTAIEDESEAKLAELEREHHKAKRYMARVSRSSYRPAEVAF